ncbi:hypothetical protein K525DRAFT_212732 [Schizophyllum commune Loenen D]|nr:hypothetical protein K525DRAFT_212732 [Schizophyllum commune Loenen D]
MSHSRRAQQEGARRFTSLPRARTASGRWSPSPRPAGTRHHQERSKSRGSHKLLRALDWSSRAVLRPSPSACDPGGPPRARGCAAPTSEPARCELQDDEGDGGGVHELQEVEGRGTDGAWCPCGRAEPHRGG